MSGDEVVFERRERLYRRVEFTSHPGVDGVLAALDAARAELRADGDQVGEPSVRYDATRRRYVVAVDLSVEEYDLIEPPSGFVGIVAFLPRDWPRLVDAVVHDITLPTLSDRVARLQDLVDDWVLAAAQRD